VIKVSQTTRDHILQVLEKATLQGWSNDQIVKEILESPEARIEVRNRARKIVRTESVRAANYGIQLGANKYEYEVEKEWLSIVDNRIRHSHRNVDGERRSVDGVFSNGLRFPGDPNGSPENTINCRCRLVMVALRDSQGRLIPKRSLQVI
jgi:SPP1 gp7 family putative phage head morphogenesis protein